MATYQILYLISIPLIIAAEYRFTRNELLQDRYDRWFNNLSLGFINEAVVLASPVLIPLLLLPESPSPYLHPLLAALAAFLILDLAGYWLHRAYHHLVSTSTQKPGTSTLAHYWRCHSDQPENRPSGPKIHCFKSVTVASKNFTLLFFKSVNDTPRPRN